MPVRGEHNSRSRSRTPATLQQSPPHRTMTSCHASSTSIHTTSHSCIHPQQPSMVIHPTSLSLINSLIHPAAKQHQWCCLLLCCGGNIYIYINQWTTPRIIGWNAWLSHKLLRHLEHRWYIHLLLPPNNLRSLWLHSVSSRTTSIDKITDNLCCKEQPTTGYGSKWKYGFSSVRLQTAALLNLRFSFKLSDWEACPWKYYWSIRC